jgi:hypothetical protein
LVNEIFAPFEQVSQVQTQLLGTTFEILSGGPAQTHVETGSDGPSSDRKNDNMVSFKRKL